MNVIPAYVILNSDEIIDICERYVMAQGYILAEGRTSLISKGDVELTIYIESSVPNTKK